MPRPMTISPPAPRMRHRCTGEDMNHCRAGAKARPTMNSTLGPGTSANTTVANTKVTTAEERSYARYPSRAVPRGEPLRTIIGG